MNFSKLSTWGWNDYFLRQYFEHKAQFEETELLLPARIIGEERGLFRIRTLDESIQWGQPRGRLLENKNLATGDWVFGAIMTGTDRMIINHRCERRSLLGRKDPGSDHTKQILGVNIDTVFIVNSLNADFSLRRIERYLALILDSGIQPVVLLSKSDLVECPQDFIDQVNALKTGAAVLLTSALTGNGLPELSAYALPGSTLAFVGSSGVGKSSLVNALLNKEVQKISAIRDVDSTGRHTTTSRLIIPLPSGACVLDTPGLREVGLWIENDGIQRAFADIDTLSKQCRFGDCQHESEPGCAIKHALEEGTLDVERLESFKKLLRELRYQQRKTDKALASGERKKWKQIAKSLKLRDKLRVKRG